MGWHYTQTVSVVAGGRSVVWRRDFVIDVFVWNRFVVGRVCLSWVFYREGLIWEGVCLKRVCQKMVCLKKV